MKARVKPETRKAFVLGDTGWWEKPRTFRAPHLIIEEARAAKGHSLPQTLYPKPSTRQDQTANLVPQSLYRKPCNANPVPETLYRKPVTKDPRPL